jgi:hypothetical protein
MAALSMTIGDTRQFQLALIVPSNSNSGPPRNVPADLTGAQMLTFVLQRQFGAVGAEVARWTLGAQVALVAPPAIPSYYTPAMIAVGWASQMVAILTVTPAMINWVRPPMSWTGENTWAADTQLAYSWSLVDALGNPTLKADSGTFTLVATP